MKSVTVKIILPEDNCTGCRFHTEEEVIEVGMSPNIHWCSLFDKKLGYNPKPCKECKELKKKGQVDLRY